MNNEITVNGVVYVKKEVEVKYKAMAIVDN